MGAPTQNRSCNGFNWIPSIFMDPLMNSFVADPVNSRPFADVLRLSIDGDAMRSSGVCVRFSQRHPANIAFFVVSIVVLAIQAIAFRFWPQVKPKLRELREAKLNPSASPISVAGVVGVGATILRESPRRVFRPRSLGTSPKASTRGVRSISDRLQDCWANLVDRFSASATAFPNHGSFSRVNTGLALNS